MFCFDNKIIYQATDRIKPPPSSFSKGFQGRSPWLLLVEELKLDRVDFIKFDIEGAEHQALRGARETLRRLRPRLAMSAYHLPDDARTLPAEVRENRAFLPDIDRRMPYHRW